MASRFGTLRAMSLLGVTALLFSVAQEARADGPLPSTCPAASAPSAGGRITAGTPDSVPAAAAERHTAPVESGTEEEARDYARREAASPVTADFEGGHHGILVFGLLVGAVVLLILLLEKQGKS